MLLTIGVLHTAFLLGFFGWKGSWAYYSYLPVLGLTLAATMMPLKHLLRGTMFATLIALMFLSHAGLFIECVGAWGGKQRTVSGPGIDGGLWYWPGDQTSRPVSLVDQWKKALAHVGPADTVVMTDGWLPGLPVNVHMRDTWFPQPGIPTDTEIQRLKDQVKKADYIILWGQYKEFDVWNSEAFKEQRDQFIITLTQQDFTVLGRASKIGSGPATTGAATTTRPALEPESHPATTRQGG